MEERRKRERRDRDLEREAHEAMEERGDTESTLGSLEYL